VSQGPESENPVLGPGQLAGLARGRARFNRADFWSSHEAWESVWLSASEADRPALQGLIQSGAAFHKLLVQDNPRGALRLLQRALLRLETAGPERFGLDLAGFRSQLARWVQRLEQGFVAPPTIAGLPQLDWEARTARTRLRVEAVGMHGLRLGDRRAILVSVEAGGLVGWGECRRPWGHHGTWSCLATSLIPALLSEPIASPAEIPELWSDVADDPFAAAGVEAAIWDLWARQRGLPLVAALGLASRPVPLAGRVRHLDPERMRAEIELLVGLGYPHIVLPARPNADRRTIPALAARLPVDWSVDLAFAYRRADISTLKAIEAAGPTWLADPVPCWDLAGAALLARWLEVPLACAVPQGPDALESSLALDALDILRLDPGRSGLSLALQSCLQAAAHGLPVSVTSTAVTRVGALSDLALSAHPAVGLPADLSHARDREHLPLLRPGSSGALAPLDQPGLGYAPSPDWLAAHVRRVQRFVA
jgi:O-succinylbenzoate synthase